MFGLDRAACLGRLKTRARQVLDEFPEVLEIRLFGSLSRGDAGPRSDADLLVILRDSAMPFLDRVALFQRRFSGQGLGCDVFPYTVPEAKRMREENNGILKAADRDGLVLASRG